MQLNTDTKEVMTRPATPQEAFWQGDFGTNYIERNKSEKLLDSNTALFSQILGHTKGVQSVLEIGANIGLNLKAIRAHLPQARLTAIEINAKAAEELRKIEGCEVHHMSVLDYSPQKKSDLVLSKTVLIHMPPEMLPDVYKIMHDSSDKYILIAEYYNPTPMEVVYRGNEGKLFKRDFAGEMLAKYPDLRLVNYGFVYHGDPEHPQDDITWFLMEKTT
jgi:spore coat polysaccharide biosynthesis protein SpsF